MTYMKSKRLHVPHTLHTLMIFHCQQTKKQQTKNNSSAKHTKSHLFQQHQFNVATQVQLVLTWQKDR